MDALVINRSLTVIKTARPPFLVLTPVCLLPGVAAAILAGADLDVSHLLLVFVGALCAHISANSFNEYFDFDCGLDERTQRTPFSGGSGALPTDPAALISVLWFAIATLAVTIAVGLYFVALRGLPLMALGLIGVITLVGYSRWINRSPGLCLIAPGLAFGPLFAIGTYLSLVPSEDVTLGGIQVAFLLSLLGFFLSNNLLLLNQFPDIDADRSVGRRTFPVVFGPRASLQVYLLFLISTATVILFLVATGILSYYTLVALGPLVLGLRVYLQLRRLLIDDPENWRQAMISSMGMNVLMVLLTPAIHASIVIVTSIH